MTEHYRRKRRKLSHEILGLIALSAGLSLLLFLILSGGANAAIEVYCFDNDIPMTEFDWIEVDQWVLTVSLILSVCFFSVLFLLLLADRMAYIRKITAGIDALRTGCQINIPLEGNNELTSLAEAIHYMSHVQREMRSKEQMLSQQKDQLIHTLSHDIRTPLTSLLAYADYLTSGQDQTAEEQAQYLEMIQKKALQIRDLTNVLLDGGKRNLEAFADGRLLMEQLAAQWEEELEDRFTVLTELANCPIFSGNFDVQELQRIFDNLSSNVQKYADPSDPVRLSIEMAGKDLVIRQQNSILSAATQPDSLQLGIRSIRRIAQNYGGQVTVHQEQSLFEIIIRLSDY